MKPSTTSSLLSLRDLTVTYSDGHTALRPTRLEIARGEFVVLLGASGAGKSTLLRSLNGLVTPTGGEVLVPDLPGGALNRRTLRAHRRECGMVFQQHHLIGRQTVLANVLMGRVARRSALGSVLPWSTEDKTLALTAIERVGLLEKALARADTLSGGQQQRVGIARALVQQPRLLLADEPVASLDPASAEKVLDLLHGICRKDRLTAVVSLHQVHLARRYADRIVGLRAGSVVFDGPPQALTDTAAAALYAQGATATPAPVRETLSPDFPASQELQPC